MTSAVTSPKTRSSRRQNASVRRATRRGQANQVATATPPLSTENQQASPQPSSVAAPLVTLTGVTKTYNNGSKALRNINLQVKKGDFLFITGPSGAGKSTLLKLLYGQERATSGEIVVDDQNLAKLRGNRLAMLRRRIGIVFQDYKLIPRRTVAENVSFVLWAQGYNRREINRRLRPTLRMVGLQHKSNSFPDQLSGGEQQRVSIARAVVGTPPLLLADEPTGNLDGDNSRQVIKILEKLNSIGITVIVTTHDEQIVRNSNHPVVQIQDGRLTYVRH
ncbi:MAG: cell division ATP-binding protein FtsE [Cyanobacteria bacterium P01_D01_bin.56]